MTVAPIRVLLVDDHEMLLTSLERVLADIPDIEVVGALGSVAEALHAAHSVGVDVAVMDYVLPDGDGIDLAERWIQVVPAAPVLLLTGSGDERLLTRALQAGCSGFLTKDRALNELVTAIRVVAAGNTWIPASLLGRLLPQRERTSSITKRDLSPREMEVLDLAAQGLGNAAIAHVLYLSVNTVRNHMQKAITKLGAHSKLEAVAVAVREGFITFPAGRHRSTG